MSLRYVLSEIRTHWRDRTWWRKRFLTHVVSRYFAAFGDTSGESILQRDWDNLLIMDACRYDLFEEVYEESELSGTLGERTSVNTGTPGFLRDTFGEGTYHDIVYISGNPYVRTELDRDQFHAVIDVWEDDWDHEDNTVQPAVMADRTLEAAERYPDKRLVSHFLQPHYPFIGEQTLGEQQVFPSREHALGNTEAIQQTPTPFELLEQGEVSKDDVWTAYRSNLECAIPAMKRLLTELSGKTVVTSDHGNALGEHAMPFPIRVYGHPLGIHIPALTRVPWLENTNGDRKAIKSTPPETAPEDDEILEDTKDRLRMLGYAE